MNSYFDADECFKIVNTKINKDKNLFTAKKEINEGWFFLFLYNIWQIIYEKFIVINAKLGKKDRTHLDLLF